MTGRTVLTVSMVLVLVFTARLSAAADNNLQQWTTAMLEHRLGNRLFLGFFAQGRFGEDKGRTNVLLTGPTIGFRLSPAVAIGFGYQRFEAFPSRIPSENRPLQEVLLRHGFHRLRIVGRFRIAQRLIESIDGPIVRTRYGLRLVHPLWDSRWYAVGSNELFVNVNSQGAGPVGGFEQNRLMALLGRSFGDHVRVEIGYMWRPLELRNQELRNDHIIVANLFFDTKGTW